MGPEGDHTPLWRRVADDAAVALCAELIGSGERAHELAVEYAKNRVQFGRPIATFQAIRHKAVDMLHPLLGVDIEWEVDGRAAGLPDAACVVGEVHVEVEPTERRREAVEIADLLTAAGQADQWATHIRRRYRAPSRVRRGS